MGARTKTLRTARTVEEKESGGLEEGRCSRLRLSRTVSGAVSDPLDRPRGPRWRHEVERPRRPRPPGSQSRAVGGCVHAHHLLRASPKGFTNPGEGPSSDSLPGAGQDARRGPRAWSLEPPEPPRRNSREVPIMRILLVPPAPPKKENSQLWPHGSARQRMGIGLRWILFQVCSELPPGCLRKP